jgi:Na+/H+ antiporter NhaC
MGQEEPAAAQPAPTTPASTDTQEVSQPSTTGSERSADQPSADADGGQSPDDPGGTRSLDEDQEQLTATGSATAPIAEAETPAEATPVSTPRDPKSYGLWVLIPALIAILLAILARQVIPALVVGVIVGSFMMVPCLAPGDALADTPHVIAGLRLAAERYILGAVTDSGDNYGHISIIVFTLVIGFTVGVIGRNGGTDGMVSLVAGKTSSRRRVGLTAWLAGLVVFFDDYSNTMIVGPTMRSVFDRVKLSRAKLAYIVDSTAAPVASIALIGTWVGTEIGLIQDGLDAVTKSGTPAFLVSAQGEVLGGMQTFVASIAYRFYPILALFLVFLVALTGLDFGPMKRAERKVLSKIDPDPRPQEAEGTADSSKPEPRWWLAFCPILVLILGTVLVLVVTGYYRTAAGSITVEMPWWQKAATITSNGDTYLSIYYGALMSAVLAVLLTMVVRACTLLESIDAGLDGMAKMFPAMVVLVLAWALSGVLQNLQLGDIVAAKLHGASFPAQWLPFSVFSCAAIISFATGTSWGTMAILCPMTVDIAARLIAGVDVGEARPLFYASVGSVLAGAVFGDHCSPISDTTVLSSIASGCRHEEHVWTQIPYALVAAIGAMGLGDVMCSVYKQPWYYGLGAGAIFLVLVLLIFGRRAQPSFELADA